MNILLIALVLIASAFFSGLEFAFISANKLRVELQKQKSGLVGRALSMFYEKPSQFLGTTLIGNNIALVIYSLLMAKLLEPQLELIYPNEFFVLFAQSIISAILILIFGEFLPKNLFRLNPSAALSFFAIPFAIIWWILRLPVIFVVWIADLLLKLFFNIKDNNDTPALGYVDLHNYVQQTHEHVDDKKHIVDTALFSKAIELRDIKIKECMVPRPEINGIDISSGIDIEVIKDAFIKTQHSKLILYKDSIDNIIGYIHHQDILANEINGKALKHWELIIVPETMPAAKLLNRLIGKQRSMAWVVNEFGGTAGIVTLEDIIEEVFGDIQDEHDHYSLQEKIIDDNEYEFAARLEIDYLNEKYSFNIPSGEYETLAGYILSKHESIPQKSQTIFIDNFEITILESSNSRIKTIRLKVL